MEQYVMIPGIMKMPQLYVQSLDSLPMVILYFQYCVYSIHLSIFIGAIAITGGLYSNDSVSVVIGQVQCVGNENGLVDCPHVNKPHDQVSSCDPSQVAAVSCHGMLKLVEIHS